MKREILKAEVDLTDNSVYCGVYKITETWDLPIDDVVYRHITVYRNADLKIVSDFVELRKNATFLVELEK